MKVSITGRRTSVRIVCAGAVAALAALSPLNASAAAVPEQKTHAVRAGDTLARLAHRYYGDGKKYSFLARANAIQNPHLIYCGQVLVIPPAPVEEAPAPQVELQPVTPGISSAAAQALAPLPAPEAVPVLAPAVPAAALALDSGPSSLVPALDIPPPFLWRQEPTSVFGAGGEKLTFAIRWKFITVGYATMNIDGIEEFDGRRAYHIVTSARSAPFFDTFYRVRDVNESWMDVESLCSLKYASNTDENHVRKNETVLLNHERQEYRIVESGKTGAMTQWAQDVLSSLYYLRTKDLEVGRDFSFDAHTGDKSWPLRVNVVRKEKIKVPAGEFECYVVEPSIREGAGLFQAKGKLWVWLTADSRKIPVMMRSKIAVGSIEALLTGMELSAVQ